MIAVSDKVGGRESKEAVVAVVEAVVHAMGEEIFVVAVVDAVTQTPEGDSNHLNPT